MKKIAILLCALVLLFSLFGCTRGTMGETVAFAKGSARVIAHRGLSGLVTENTEGAFVAAGERSYFGIEADVRKTADGQFVICHDETLSRIAGKNICVEASTLEELLAVPLINSEGDFPDTGRLTELGIYLSVCKTYGKEAILELKSAFTEEEIGRIVEIVRSYDYIEGVTFISFRYDNLLYVRRFLPRQSVQYLFSSVSEELTDRLIEDSIDAAVAYYAVTKQLIDRMHAAGLAVNCWTVDSKEVAEQLVELGVDYITTNILE